MFSVVGFWRFAVCLFFFGVIAGNAWAGVWFKGESALRDNVSNVEKHRLYVKWMLKARGAEDAMVVQMTVSPDSPVIGRTEASGDIVPLDMTFDMLDSKGKSLGEVKFSVSSENFNWSQFWIVDYLRKWNRNSRDLYRYDCLGTTWKKMVMLYFHGFFTPPRECTTLFLKSVRTREEDVYYDLGNTGPKIVSNRLKASIDKRSIRGTVEVNATAQQGEGADPAARQEEKAEEEKPEEAPSRRRPGLVAEEREATESEAVGRLQEQLRDQKAKCDEARAEAERLRRDYEEIKGRYDGLKAANEAKAAEAESAKDASPASDRDAQRLRELEKSYSDSAERILKLNNDLDALRQENQALLESARVAGSRQTMGLVVIVVLLGLLGVLGFRKSVR